MDFFLCASSSALAHAEHDQDLKRQGSSEESFLPQVVESSCSEQSSESPCPQHHPIERRSLQPPVAGSTSPSAICQQRKLSTAIATTLDAKHPVLEGRRVVAAPKIGRVISTLSQKPKMPIPRPALPKAPKSTCSILNEPTPTMNSSSQKRSVAPLPSDPEPVTKPASKPALHRAASAPVKDDPSRSLRIHPPPLKLNAWTEPAAEAFNVRGPNYLNDKAKVPSLEAAFRLLTVDMVQVEKPLYSGMCAHPGERVQQALEREKETGVRELPPFVFAVNLCVPGDKTYHQVSYFAIDNFEEIKTPKTSFGKLMHKFIFGDSDEFRLKTFKLIPRIVEGNFVVRKAVGSKPTILGRKINHYFIRGENYFEVIVDIASDPVAQRIVKLVLGYTKTLVVDMMFLLEGISKEYLPERVFGGVRLKNIDLRKDGARQVEH